MSAALNQPTGTPTGLPAADLERAIAGSLAWQDWHRTYDTHPTLAPWRRYLEALNPTAVAAETVERLRAKGALP